MRPPGEAGAGRPERPEATSGTGGADAAVATDGTVDWDGILDRLEQALTTGVEFEPPVDVPAMPERLLPRAQALLDRQREVVSELEAEHRRIGDELAGQRRGAPRPPGAPSGAALSL